MPNRGVHGVRLGSINAKKDSMESGSPKFRPELDFGSDKINTVTGLEKSDEKPTWIPDRTTSFPKCSGRVIRINPTFDLSVPNVHLYCWTQTIFVCASNCQHNLKSSCFMEMSWLGQCTLDTFPASLPFCSSFNLPDADLSAQMKWNGYSQNEMSLRRIGANKFAILCRFDSDHLIPNSIGEEQKASHSKKKREKHICRSYISP